MSSMHRTLGSVGAWLVATSLAVLVSWLGVQSVRFAAVPDRVSPMSAAEARKQIPLSGSPSAAPNAPSGSPSASASASASASPTPFPTGAVSTPDTTAGWTAEPDGKGGTALLRTIGVKGGSARFRFARDEVRVLSTDPDKGFTMSFGAQSPTIATVTFSSPEHTSKITAFWDGGAKAQISETPA
jgi:hypothetical protein